MINNIGMCIMHLLCSILCHEGTGIISTRLYINRKTNAYLHKNEVIPSIFVCVMDSSSWFSLTKVGPILFSARIACKLEKENSLNKFSVKSVLFFPSLCSNKRREFTKKISKPFCATYAFSTTVTATGRNTPILATVSLRSIRFHTISFLQVSPT